MNPPKLDRAGDAGLIAADDLAQILGIEPGRERGRADEVAEHHAERAALGGDLKVPMLSGDR